MYEYGAFTFSYIVICDLKALTGNYGVLNRRKE